MEWSIPKLWKGKTCWILGGGVSVSEQFNIPLDFIPKSRDDFYEYGSYLAPILDQNIIGVNLGAFVSDQIKIAFFGDNDTYLDFKLWYDCFAGLKVSAAGKFADKKYKSIYHVYKNNDKGISTDPTEVSWIAFNSAAAAINLAYHLGVKKVILLGVDLYKTGDRVHWHAGYPDKAKTLSNAQIKRGLQQSYISQAPFLKHSPGYYEIAKDAKELGLTIINASPKSTLTCFPKMSVKDILNG